MIEIKQVQAFKIVINQTSYIRINGVWYHGDRAMMWCPVLKRNVDQLEKAFQDYVFSQYPERVQKALLEREELCKNGGPATKDLDRIKELGEIIHEAIEPGIDRLFTEEMRIIHEAARILKRKGAAKE